MQHRSDDIVTPAVPTGAPRTRNEPDGQTFAQARELLGGRMPALRGAARMPQSVAAARAGIDRGTWRRIELGQLDPRLDTLLRIQYALEVDSIDGLFGRTTGDLFVADFDTATTSPAPS